MLKKRPGVPKERTGKILISDSWPNRKHSLPNRLTLVIRFKIIKKHFKNCQKLPDFGVPIIPNTSAFHSIIHSANSRGTQLVNHMWSDRGLLPISQLCYSARFGGIQFLHPGVLCLISFILVKVNRCVNGRLIFPNFWYPSVISTIENS